jgi:hypothetical protein
MAMLSLLVGASGIASHLLLYRFGEWDVSGPSLVLAYLILLSACLYIDHSNLFDPSAVGGPELLQPLWAVRLMGCHIAGIYLSMIVHRLVWHRLRKFPGPLLARVSNFYITALSAKKYHLYEEVEKLHKQYGDYVRLGK